jgi:hypothetical protein
MRENHQSGKVLWEVLSIGMMLRDLFNYFNITMEWTLL